MNDPGGEAYWRHVEDLFHRALDLEDGSREAFLREECAGDAKLEAEIREILEGYEAQDRISSSQTEAGAGSRFGAFEMVRKIGEGGMAVVYLGRRFEDFEQHAAIKVFKGSPAGAALMAERLRMERQILAGLEHPNVARLLDGGVTRSGQPYLVMEYVDGERLDKYCARLSIPERLRLFRKICVAVHYAHQRLVIHRDLKPGNILVDASGEPKLLDFGIAKVLAEPGTSYEQTMSPATMLLTPRYASPEQIRGQPCTVTSDVYSLGVILYELLTGRGRYSTSASTPAEWISAIVTEEAPRPSSVVPPDQRAALRGDLDGIVLKALAVRPEDRYGSAEQLSADIGRHLDGLPVSAVEGTRPYLARKFVRRHGLAVSAAAAVVLTLCGGFAATLWEARIARRQRDLAEQRFSDARKLANYLLFPLFDQVQPLPGSLPVRADMASQSLQYLDRLSAARSKDYGLRLELAEGYARLGTILESPVGSGDNLGDTSQALATDRKALALLESLAAERPTDDRVQQNLARTLILIGNILNLTGKPDDGGATVRRAAAILDRLAAAKPGDPARLLDAGRANLALADTLSGSGYFDKTKQQAVETAVDRSIADFQSVLNSFPDDSGALLGLAQAENLKGTAVASTDEMAQAASIYRQGLDALRKMPANRQTPDSEALEARLESSLGWSQGALGRYDEALSTLRTARDILDRLAAADPKNATNQWRRVIVYRNRGMLEQDSGRSTDSIVDFRQTLDILDGMIAADPAKLRNRMVRAEIQGRLGQMLAKQGRMDEAVKHIKASLDFLIRLADQADCSPQNLKEAVAALIQSPIPALADYRRALGYALRVSDLAKGKDLAAFLYIAQCYEMLGDGPKAMDAIQRGMSLLPPLAPGEKPPRNRVLMERHLRRIQVLVKTGHLPPE